jgi:hypothetical protein
MLKINILPATVQILPGTGRCPRGAEGSQLSACAALPELGTPPSLRATSPVRGGF